LVEVRCNNVFLHQNFPSQSGSSYQSAIQFVYTVPSIYPAYRVDESGDLILDGKGQRIFDYGATWSSFERNRPQLNNENAYGSLYNYKIDTKR
jgi:hypothetical protein